MRRVLLTIFVLVSIVNKGISENLFWIGGSGNWNDTKHWSLSSGGVSAAMFPTNSDNVIFDKKSTTTQGDFVVTINTDAVCNDITIKEEASGLTLKGGSSVKLSVLGAFQSYASTVTNDFSGTISLNKAKLKSFTSKGFVFGAKTIFEGGGLNPLAPVVTVTVTNATCKSSCNGTATAIVSGGSGSYAYTWQGTGQVAATATGLCAGTYIVTVTDLVSSETGIGVGSISEPSAIVVPFFSNTHVTCNGLCNGSSTPVLGGGTPGYTFVWSPGGQTGSTATGLCAATYTLLVTDANTCTSTFTTTITQPNTLVANGNTKNISCNGVCTGSVGVAPTGGTTPYTYSWSTGLTSTTVNGLTALCANTYSVVVRDSKGCTASYSGTVSEPSVLSVGTSSTNVSCGGLCDGVANANGVGGTLPYTYAWSNSGAVASVSGLCAAAYTVTVTDGGSCTKTATVTITQPLTLTVSPTQTPVTCFNLCNGAAAAGASGGTSPYSYVWSNTQTDASATALCANTYTVVVTDFNLCTTTGTITVTQPNVLGVTTTSANVACNAVCTGSASATGSGGTLPYTYAWSNAATSAAIGSLCASNYTITVTDGNSCSVTSTLSISEPTALSGNPSSVSTSCSGACDGSASIAPSGGTTPYTYAWSNSAVTSGINNVCAANYTVVVTDASSCSITRTVNVIEPNTLNLSIATNTASCNAGCNGTAAVTVLGGTAPYTYAWSNAATGNSVTGLCAGTYTVVVTDAGLCSKTETVSIAQPVAISSTLTSTDVLCFSQANGEIDAEISGGTTPYNYSWSPGGQTTQDLTGLTAGTYTLSITDGNLCPYTETVTVSQPNVLSINPSITNVTCSGDCDGTATANALGGTTPYSYAWSTGDVTASVSDLCAGSYTLSVLDDNNCPAVQTFSVSQPTVLSAQITGSTPTCALCNGTATGFASGGTAPYNYLWSDGQTTLVATGLCIGSYTFTATDFNLCVATATVDIVQTVNIAINVSAPNISCFGACDGIATATPSGGNAPYTYSWSTNETAATISNLCAGTYTIEVNDSQLCFNTATVTLTEPAILAFSSATSSDISCFGADDGDAAVAVTGGTTPYTYAWLPGGETTSSLTGLSAGTYTIDVRDVNGCTIQQTFIITEPTQIVSNYTVTTPPNCSLSDGNVATTPSGGTLPYTYVWSNAATTQNLSNVAAGTYSLTITDGSGCSTSELVNVANITGPTITTFSSNISCNGLSDGVVGVTPAGGAFPYTYSWLVIGNTTDFVSNLPQGTYTSRVDDNIGCIVFTNITITEPAQLVSDAVYSDVTCNALCNGTANVTATGGTAPYTYVWSSGGYTTGNITTLCANSYTVVVTDANNCSDTEVFTITEPTVLTSTLTYNDIVCFGQCNGGATANPAGGITPYTYAWSTGAVISSITNLCANTYSLVITDDNNCSITNTVVIVEPPLLTTTLTSTNITCNAYCDGTASVAVNGGTGAYTYAWSPGGETIDALSALCPGTYIINVTDANSCASTKTVSITEPNALAIGLTTTSVSCNSICSGVANSLATGGTAPYTYAWSTGASISSITGLCAGSYTISLTDTNMCSVAQIFTIDQPTPLLANALNVAPACFGSCDAVVFASPVGGTTPYTYNWQPGGQLTPAVLNQCSGTYTVTVTDRNGCSDVKTTTVTDPQQITILTAQSPPNCGSSNGSITVTPVTGVGPYIYQWSPSGQTSAAATGLAAGIYTLTVTDIISCQETFTITLNNNGGPTGETVTVVDALCFGNCDGSISVSPVGGTTPYTYSWTDGQTNALATGLCMGTYILEVKDASNCIRFVTDEVDEPDQIDFGATITNATCGGICDGDISLAPSGGTGAYTYLWSNAETTAQITALCGGSYTITLTDDNACEYSNTLTVNQNITIAISHTVTNSSCNGSCTGTANFSASGGSGAYSYLWQPGGFTSTSLTGLCSGTYTITATDTLGCFGTTTVQIAEPTSLSAATNSVAPTCNQCDGQASLVPSGGTAPYTYVWGVGGTDSLVTGLCAGMITYTVYDSFSCNTSGSFVLNNNGGPTGETFVTTSVTCFGACDGTASITPIGGISPYTYSWSTGETSSVANGLCGGVHSVQVTDSLGCVRTTTVSIDEPTQLAATPVVTDATCGLCDGVIAVSPTGGTTPYTFAWNTASTASSVSALCVGIYTVVVTDANNCSQTLNVPVSNPNGPAIGLTTTSVTCFGFCDGTAISAASGATPPYTYLWSNASTDTSITGLCAGNYNIQLSDNAGCVSIQLFTVSAPAVVSGNASNTTPTCFGNCDGAIVMSGTGGISPYSYLWNTTETTSSISALCAGNYTVTITDFNGCSTDVVTTLTPPAVLTVTNTVTNPGCGLCDGVVTLSPLGGSSPYTFNWSNGQTGQSITGVCAGSISYTVQDANSCTQSGVIVINSSNGPTGETITTTSVTCFGLCNGVASITPIGGTAPYTYDWGGGQTGQTISGLCVGDYSVQITDGQSCVRTATLQILEPSVLATTSVVTDATCGLCDGGISVTPNGGTSPYTYLWDDGSTNNNVSLLCIGVYTVTVRDANNCSQTSSIPVSNPNGPSLTLTTTSVNCYGACTGSATAIVSGVMGPYTYSWSNSNTTDTLITNVCGGNYSIKVSDNLGCATINVFTIDEPAQFIENATITSPTCGQCNGLITLAPTGGTLPISYQWNTGDTITTVSNVCAGAYNLLVTDGNNCTKSITYPVSNTGGPTGETITTTSVSCFGQCTGTATVTPVGGTAPYTYLWLVLGNTTNSVTGLCADDYYIQVSDANSCIRTTSLSIAEPPTFTINPTVVAPTCGVCDGVITLNPTGGTSPYTFSWNTGDVTAAVSNLCAGNYSVTVSDVTGCPTAYQVALNNPGISVAVITTSVSCFGVCDGTATSIVTGTNTPFTYSWNNGDTNANTTGLCDGNYSMQVTDNIGCIAVTSFSIDFPLPVAANLPITTNPTCFGDCDGNVNIIAIGGVSPYNYSWSNGNTTSASTGLCAATYTLVISDKNGCSNTLQNQLTEPSALVLTKTVTPAVCSNVTDGTIDITVSGGTTTYTYQWSGSVSATTEDITNLAAGTYTVLVTDAKGCTQSDTASFSYQLILNAIAGNDTSFCEGALLALNGTASTNAITYQWTDLATSTTVGVAASVTVTPTVGTTNYILTIVNGVCTDKDTVMVSSVALPVVDAGQDVSVYLNGTTTVGGNPTGPVGSTYNWIPVVGLSNPTDANPVATPSVTTSYTVIVTTSLGCSNSDNVVVTVLPEISFYNGLSPNGDGVNDYWMIDNIQKFPNCLVEVYNRWGELLFSSVGYSNPWDGTYKGEQLPVGTYYYVINLNDSEFPDPYSGPIVIMR
ncbi:MAG: gliding motility-associated C-terminal domain-containing protein [Bacteroidetes bacterium]|nr:gliding motility-associated C-terminal domain-containing protein [Bacteroidota bacterium]